MHMDIAELACLCRLPVPTEDPTAAVLAYMDRLENLKDIPTLHFGKSQAREDIPRDDQGDFGPFLVPAAGS